MRVAFLTLATRGGASPRYRVYQYVPWLEQAGIECRVLPAVSEWVSRHLYLTGTRAGNAAYQAIELARRLAQVVRVASVDVVVVQKALLTVGLRGLDILADAAARRLVLDIDDAVHLGPPHRLPPWMRGIEDVGQPARLLARADRVVAGSAALAKDVQAFNKRVTVVPTSVDTDRLVPGSPSGRRVPVIGWIGSQSTAPYLATIGPALQRLARSTRFVLRVVGGPAPALPGVTVDARRWDPAGELADLQSFDVGVMPMPDTPWTRGKCGLKAVQYLAVGVPAVCSPVGAATEIVRPGHDGFLPATQGEWEGALEALLEDVALRARLGAAGRARVEECYSLRSNAPKLAAILTEVAEECTAISAATAHDLGRAS